MPASCRPYAVWLVSSLYREANSGRDPHDYVQMGAVEVRRVYPNRVWPVITAALAGAGILECDDRHAPGKSLGYRLTRAYSGAGHVVVPVTSRALSKKLSTRRRPAKN